MTQFSPTPDPAANPSGASASDRPAEPGKEHNSSSRPPFGIMRTGWLILLLGFVGFLIWAAFAPIESGITASGEIVVDSQRQKVQHLSGGIVEEILVRDGDHVEQGQVVVRLNRTRLQSELAIIQSQLLTALATEARLLAERARQGQFSYPQMVEEASSNDPRVAEAMHTQRQLFRTRRLSLQNEKSILDQQIRGLNEQLQGIQAQAAGKNTQLALLQEELTSLKTLFDQGYVPRSRIFELERAVADIHARRSDDQAQLGRIQSALSEARLQKLQREQTYDKEIETELANTQRDIAGLEQRAIALRDELDRVEIRTPVSGTVLGLQIHTAGGIVRPGEDILDVVPDNEPLIVEARIPVQSIELMVNDLEALLNFSALSRLNPTVKGHVIHVSADRLTDERTGTPYFKARIEVPPEELKRLSYERIIPGMPVDVVIRTGERSLLHYLLQPLTDRVFSAFRER
ncbi:membrane fusion protein, protease secretion system [Lampropedia hyalina DSM 16112]|jgi:HlyD family type I secretion membrane fusion protein|uniref:Membrane fusion protein (MFP) family protein n=1 Tax=Lampropedia hyalina DSM 16112 TaxID=1122156 RepID=A0A1M4WV36_9BURK|nr:HlyD family type I secretion periplasmic adaptor subunit [Lampropedia hyalina]SHE85058.1 membrane fusion protein, protease secretion system [Lampropedia hyalina DSM 16112]